MSAMSRGAEAASNSGSRLPLPTKHTCEVLGFVPGATSQEAPSPQPDNDTD
jgi:hypothetical protein